MNKINPNESQKMQKTAKILFLIELYSIPFYVILLFNPNAQMTNLIFMVSIVIMTLVSCVLFAVHMQKSPVGVKNYLAIEGNFLTNELPSIIQIITVLSFLSFFLSDANSRGILSLFLTIILYIYLRVRRREYVRINYKNTLEHVPDVAQAHLQIVISVLLGGVVFIIAQNLSYNLS